MTSAQQNVLESKTDQQRMDSPFEVGWPTWRKENLMAGAARLKREPSLGGWHFPYLLIPKPRIFDSSVCRGVPNCAAHLKVRRCCHGTQSEQLQSSLLHDLKASNPPAATMSNHPLRFRLGALPVIDIGVDSIPTDDVCLVQLFGRTLRNHVLSETCGCAPSARSRRIHSRT
jgi:hypothetical protein